MTHLHQGVQDLQHAVLALTQQCVQGRNLVRPPPRVVRLGGQCCLIQARGDHRLRQRLHPQLQDARDLRPVRLSRSVQSAQVTSAYRCHRLTLGLTMHYALRSYPWPVLAMYPPNSVSYLPCRIDNICKSGFVKQCENERKQVAQDSGYPGN